MKVVIDTNVFVSSFFGGKPKRVIDRWKKGEVQLCLSEEVLDEYLRVLRAMDLNPDHLSNLLSLFRTQHGILYASKTPDLEIVEANPPDDKFIELAVQLDAELIVSGDRDLLSIGQYMGIQIVSPDEFLDNHPSG